MKMRLQGTLPEIEAALARLRQIFEITYKTAPVPVIGSISR